MGDDKNSMLAFESLKSFLEDKPNWNNPKYEGPRDYDGLFQMLKKHPTLATKHFRGHYGNTFPLTFLLAAKAPLRMIQEVCQMNPDAITDQDWYGLYPLHHAVWCDCSHDVVGYLLEKHPLAASTTADGELPIEILLRNLGGSMFNADAFYKNFQLLWNAHPPSQYTWEEESCLSKLMTNPNTPSNLLVWLARKKQPNQRCRVNLGDSRCGTKTLIQNLQAFVPLLSCEALCLNFARPYRSLVYTFLDQFFSQINIPATLSIVIRGFQQLVLPSTSDGNVATDWSSCKIMDLAIRSFYLSTETFGHLLKSLQSLPNLKRLSLSPGTEGGSMICCSVASFMELLEALPTLKELVFYGTQVELDLEQLWHALEKTKSAAFVKYYPPHSLIPDPKVAYQSILNHGRVKVTAPTATLQTLVGCLCSIYDHTEDGSLVSTYVEASLWYGLMREVPGLWAGTNMATFVSSTKKRRQMLELDPSKSESEVAKKTK